MSRECVIETIENLAMSQGFYGRLLRYLEELQDANPGMFEDVMARLESCSDAVDMIMMVEGGE